MRIFAGVLILLSAVSVRAATSSRLAPGYCGMVDLAKMSNAEVENVVLAENLAYHRTQLVQCGLPGEKLAICQSCAEETSEESMSLLRPILAGQGHVAWHAAWHHLRISSDQLTSVDFEKARAAGYVPLAMNFRDFKAKHLVGGDLAGEDFLAMHRLMLKMVQMHLSENNLPCFAPWTEIPAMNDVNWPVTRRDASSEWNLVQVQLKKLRNPVLLKNITLNRLGQLIEPNLHQNLHHLYQTIPVCSREAQAQGFCDDLIPVETSPLNRNFWKLHGLIDDLIGDWLNAHNYSEISMNCEGRSKCYQWGDVWAAPVRPRTSKN